MERLWSPWRLAYVSDTAPAEGCVFCRASAETGTQTELVVHRGRLAFVILNLYPYNNGHLMVVPNRHIASLTLATRDELDEVMALTALGERVLRAVYEPHGLNIGMNLGRAAGAGIDQHLHVHVVPRWSGDTNFMTAVGDVRVLPESVAAAASRLRPAFAEIAADSRS